MPRSPYSVEIWNPATPPISPMFAYPNGKNWKLPAGPMPPCAGAGCACPAAAAPAASSRRRCRPLCPPRSSSSSEKSSSPGGPSESSSSSKLSMRAGIEPASSSSSSPLTDPSDWTRDGIDAAYCPSSPSESPSSSLESPSTLPSSSGISSIESPSDSSSSGIESSESSSASPNRGGGNSGRFSISALASALAQPPASPP
ncbi:hypothetical protein T484DRAFT_1923465 [Baffinella frigidus]|nr:hypothetical protein T484DRAFT_1923465 [Cryptophyta sp. CCMP2293]